MLCAIFITGPVHDFIHFFLIGMPISTVALGLAPLLFIIL